MLPIVVVISILYVDEDWLEQVLYRQHKNGGAKIQKGTKSGWGN